MNVFDSRKFIGFEDINYLFNQFVANKPEVSFPPYNIRQLDENKYVIEIAVAGYSKELINIELEKNTLRVSSPGQEDNSSSLVWKGVSSKAFERLFLLQDNIFVQYADMVDGMLKIFLEKYVPEKDKKKTIKIGVEAPSLKDHPQLLNEDSSI